MICHREDDVHGSGAGRHHTAGFDLEPGFGLVETDNVMLDARTGVRHPARARLLIAEPLEGQRITIGISRARCTEVHAFVGLGLDISWVVELHHWRMVGFVIGFDRPVHACGEVVLVCGAPAPDSRVVGGVPFAVVA